MKNTKKLILAALFAALACVCTFAIQIPVPSTGGYIHPGDAIVILSGIFLGPVYGALAAGIGSALSDLLGGYFIYVPITFVVKAAVAFFSAHAFRLLKAHGVNPYVSVASGGIIDAILVVGGYGICETFMYGAAAAAASMFPNLIQGIGGLVISLFLFPVLNAIPDFRQLQMSSSGHHQ